MTDDSAGRECCPHVADIQRDLAGAVSMAERLVSLLLVQAGPATVRGQLRLVGSAEPAATERMADVIPFPVRRARSRLA